MSASDPQLLSPNSVTTVANCSTVNGQPLYPVTNPTDYPIVSEPAFIVTKCAQETREVRTAAQMYPSQGGCEEPLGPGEDFNSKGIWWAITHNSPGIVSTSIFNGLTYYMMGAVNMLEISLFIDIFVKKAKVILAVHSVRLVILVSVLIISLISYFKGFRTTCVSLGYDTFTKVLTLIVAIAYVGSLIYNYTKAKPEERTRGEKLLIGGASIWVMLYIYLVICAVRHIQSIGVGWSSHKTSIEIFWIIILTIIGIGLSVFRIYKSSKAIKEGKENLWEDPNVEVVVVDESTPLDVKTPPAAADTTNTTTNTTQPAVDSTTSESTPATDSNNTTTA